MKNILITLIMSLLTVSSFSQKKAPKIKTNTEYTSESGLKYTYYTHNKKSPKASVGDVVSVNYVGKFADGKVFDSSYDRKEPISFELGKGKVIKGWDEGLQNLNEGDSALLVIPPSIGYGNSEVGTIPANSTLYFVVKLEKVTKIQTQAAFDVSKKDTVKLGNNLSYIIVKKGKGESVKQNERVSFQYTLYSKDGKKFDSSSDNGGKPMTFITDRKRVIEGLDLGIKGMKVGEQRRINIPYQLGFGEKAIGPILAKSDLVFDVTLEKIEKLNYPKVDYKGKDTITLPSGIKYIIGQSTNGKQVMPNDTVTIKYVASFIDGTVFDASYDNNDSLRFIVGQKMVIEGLDKGIQMMKEGEKFKFIIPYKLAYGEEGRSPIIPPKADLIFDVNLVKIN